MPRTKLELRNPARGAAAAAVVVELRAAVLLKFLATLRAEEANSRLVAMDIMVERFIIIEFVFIVFVVMRLI